MKDKDDVSVANRLVRAAHGLNLMEKRVLMLAISKINSKGSYTEAVANLPIRFTVLEFQKVYNIDQKLAYNEVKKACKNLHRRYITLYNKTPKGMMLETVISWITKSTYADAEGWVNISVNGDLAPYLYELGECFTSYRLSRVSGFKSVYSWRLFEMCQQLKSTGKVIISIDEFCKAMELSDSYVTDFFNIKNRVIAPAIKEIAAKDGLEIAWTPHKTGAKVTSLTFTFTPEAKQEKKAEVIQLHHSAAKGKKTTRSQPAAVDTTTLRAEFNSLLNLSQLSATPLELLADKEQMALFKKYQLIS